MFAPPVQQHRAIDAINSLVIPQMPAPAQHQEHLFDSELRMSRSQFCESVLNFRVIARLRRISVNGASWFDEPAGAALAQIVLHLQVRNDRFLKLPAPGLFFQDILERPIFSRFSNERSANIPLSCRFSSSRSCIFLNPKPPSCRIWLSILNRSRSKSNDLDKLRRRLCRFRPASKC